MHDTFPPPLGRPASRGRLAIAGAGLAGTLAACLLATRGWRVDVFERRTDPRLHGDAGGRSINLALAERGIHALRAARLDVETMHHAVAMRGRMVHTIGEYPHLHPYGRSPGDVIWSIHRGRLNRLLLDAAERAGARVHHDAAVEDIDCGARELILTNGQRVAFDLLIGADGADSRVRAALSRTADLGIDCERQPHGYKELEIPAAPGGGFRIEPHALHLWPRGGYMCIALPNVEGSFTTTLFLPVDADGDPGTPSFAQLPDGRAARRLFEQTFPDLSTHVPALEADFDAHPVGMLATLRLRRWHAHGHTVLLGDAAHAMVPFHGQGMNCALEDAVALAHQLDQHPHDRPAALAAFEAERRPNALAIQAMALENYVEMRARVATPGYALERELSTWLAERHPARFVPRYSMVTFQRVPYVLAYERGKIQADILRAGTAGCDSFRQIDLRAVERDLFERLPELSTA
ncbi:MULTISPECIES: FAD-dependent oxidoreductase [Burkholderia]|uniref:Salicylate 1-monooxygenase n=1 Tax=Burkholderia paludis TaxID=1506587 RepID=A0A6J5D3R6_9BURK|nr:MULTISPECIES: NAD(P)/FAD-dependent oxidoreductase [Burkholderia]CAB3748583.1 Kynurenine 3-monooxygenase [Burkholderia paludis]VWB96968.1 Salicylate 1-monooxygenase [Burkholderia paludis]